MRLVNMENNVQDIPTKAAQRVLKSKERRSQETDPTGREQHSAGAKLDAGKVDASLLSHFSRALLEVARVGTMGQEKYTRKGWVDVPDALIRYQAAGLRHELKREIEGEYDLDPWYDTEEGKQYKGKILHRAQKAWNALAELELFLLQQEE